MLLIKDRKKNKQPRFRMMVPREFVFQPSEQDSGNLSYLDIDESLKWFGSYGPRIV